MVLWRGQPDRREEDVALAAFGLVREQPAAAEELEVWSCNWQAMQIFLRLMTQWRQGPRGRTGLDYVAAVAVMKVECVPPRRQRRLLDQLRVMEAASIEYWAGLQARA